MSSASLRIWRDTGYTEGCMEVPKASTLSNPLYSFNDLNVPRASLFSQVKVEHAYEDLYDCSYLQMTYDMNNGQDVSVYGWIDNVSCSSDTPGKPVTVIDWHVDLWRTYLSKAVFGSGYVTRRPLTSDVPSQPYSPRYQTMDLSGTELITASSNIYWCFVQCTVTVSGTSTQQTLCFPVDVMNDTAMLTIGNASTGAIKTPSFRNLISGGWDEMLGLDPDAVYGVFLSPYYANTTSYTSSYGYTMEGWYPVQLNSTSTGDRFGAFQKISVRNAYAQFYKDISGFTTTDTSTVVLKGFDNEIAGSLPWGLTPTMATWRIVEADTAMYVAYRFHMTGSYDECNGNGMEFTIPLKTLGLGSNAKSSYVYSGQQELDATSMQLQRERARSEAYTSAAVSVAGGGVNSAMMGALVGGPLGLGLAVAGTVATAAASVYKAEEDYNIAGAYNDKMMTATLKQKARQTSNLLLASSGVDWVYNGAIPKLCRLEWDDYSIEQRDNDISMYGAHVDEPTADCSSLISAGGPLQIANLIVTGPIPVQAKQYLRNRFAGGVVIV